jgi:phosphonate transport system substrate-binding protein
VRRASGMLSTLRLIALVSSFSLAATACQPAAAPAAPTSKPAEAKPAAEATKPAPPTTAASPVAKPAASPSPSPSPSPASAPSTSAPAAASAASGATGGPIRMAFVPSSDSAKVLASGKPIGDMLAKEIGAPVEVSVPTSYAAVIEAMGANQLDVAWLAPFAYVLAHQKFGSDVILSSVRGGSKTYRSQVIVPADSPITDVKELKGKKFAFVDSASASGFLYPSALLKDNGIDPKRDLGETVIAGGHDKVVIAVYNKQVDAGATFGDSAETGPPTDARTLVVSTLPDVMDKVKVLAKTDPIPNDTVSVRKGLPADTVAKVRAGLLAIAQTEDGKKVLRDLYRIDGLAEAADRDYDNLRRIAQLVGFDFEEQFKPK